MPRGEPDAAAVVLGIAFAAIGIGYLAVDASGGHPSVRWLAPAVLLGLGMLGCVAAGLNWWRAWARR